MLFCNDPAQLSVPFIQSFDWRLTRIADLESKVHLLGYGTLKRKTLSDSSYFCAISLISKDALGLVEADGSVDAMYHFQIR